MKTAIRTASGIRPRRRRPTGKAKFIQGRSTMPVVGVKVTIELYASGDAIEKNAPVNILHLVLGRIPVPGDWVALDHYRGDTWHVFEVDLLPVPENTVYTGSVAVVKARR